MFANPDNIAFVLLLLDYDPTMLLKEMQEAFASERGIAVSTQCLAKLVLHQLRLTRKVVETSSTQRRDADAARYTGAVLDLCTWAGGMERFSDMVLFVDESGMVRRKGFHRRCGRSRLGMPCVVQSFYVGEERVNIFAGAFAAPS